MPATEIPPRSSAPGAGSGSARGYSEAVTGALADPSARVDYDFSAQTPFIVSGGGATLSYFDDADSLARKLALVHSQKLAGAAAWRLGFEDGSFWSILG